MKRFFLVLAILLSVLPLPAQTNAPARLALIAESADASAAVDVLTAQLSGNKNVQLLERNEIEKVYREQGLSAGNKDYVKLGQILGADGLLLMETAKDGTNQYLNVRLVAVKPGVVLVTERFPWPMKSLTEWSPIVARHLDIFLPNDAAAMAALGDLYVAGRNVPQDPVEAWAWFRLAADQGSSSGRNQLSQVEVKMTPQQIESAKQRVNELKDWAQKIQAASKYLGD